MSNPVADILLSIGALRISPREPFTYRSGLRGPVYCDNRIVLGHPPERKQVVLALKNLIADWRPDGILALATGAISHGAWLAEELELPFGYVRAEAKGYGRGQRVEGFNVENASVVVLEDLINTGSALARVLPELSKHFSVRGIASIVSYNTMQARELFSSYAVEVRSLVNLADLVEAAKRSKLITLEDEKILQRWQEKPKQWEETP